MKILYISNFSTLACGVRMFGDLMLDALRRAGVQVDPWDGTYAAIVARGTYLPPDAHTYDVIHLNWDPQAINHFLPGHFPEAVPLSLFLHDVPPNSTCPVWDQARWRFAFEPVEDGAGQPLVEVFEEPVPPTPSDLPAVAAEITIGVSGIRQDPGHRLVQEVCTQQGWRFNAPGWWADARRPMTPWLSTDDEIRRLAQSTINVCWYHTSGRGKSMAAMICGAARRPLLLSGSSMFSACWPYDDEITIAHQTHYRADPEYGNDVAPQYRSDLLPELTHLLQATQRGTAARPTRINHELSWDRQIRTILQAWQDGRKGKDTQDA